MPDGFVQIRAGEIRPVYVQETVKTGTLTIGSSPAPIVTLYNADGTILSDYASLPATGYDTDALAAPRVWFLLDTTLLPAGYYTLHFYFMATASDGTDRIYAPSLEVQILDVRA